MTLARKLLMASRLEIAFKNSATSTADTVTWPSVAAGDLAVLFDFADGAITPPSSVTPSGFTNIVDIDGASTRLMVSYKICTGSESGSLTGMDAATADFETKTLLIFEAGISNVTASTWNEQVTDGNPDSQNVAASGVAVPLIVFGAAAEEADATAPTFATASPAFDAEVSHNMMIVGYKIYNSNPQNHDVDIADTGTANTLVSGYLRVS